MCIKIYTRKERIAKTVKMIKKPLPSWVIRGLFYTGLFVFIIIVIMIMKNISYINLTEQYVQNKVSDLVGGLKVEAYSSIEIIKPANGAKVFSSVINIEGKADRCGVVGLYINGELVQTTKTNSPLFYFHNVELFKKENVIQAKCFGDFGNVFSKAIVVYYIDSNNSSSNYSYTQMAEDNLLRGNLYRKEIALTFDGGSKANLAQDILSILKRYSLVATFFLTGEFINNNPEIVRQIVSDGHEVGNHTYSHPHLTTYSINKKQITLENVSKEFLIEELRKTDEAFYRITGKHMSPFWRSPYGENNAEIRRWASEAGYTHVGWTSGRDETLDTLDWVADSNVSQYRSSNQIAEQILSFGQGTPYGANGGIILMHLGSERKDDYPDQAIPIIIDGYLSRGYKFVSISHLLNHKDDIVIASGK